MDKPDYSKWERKLKKIFENNGGTTFVYWIKTDSNKIISTELSVPLKGLTDEDVASMREGFLDQMALDVTISGHKENLICRSDTEKTVKDAMPNGEKAERSITTSAETKKLELELID